MMRKLRWRRLSMTKGKYLRKSAPLIVFLTIVLFLAIGLTRDPRTLPSNMIDRAMPEFELPDLYNSSQMRTKTDMLGRTSVINIFGSWCRECLVEHPTFLQVGPRDDFDLVGVNWRDEQSNGINWLRKHADPYDYVLSDFESSLAIELGVTGAPETFIVDPNGRIRYKHVGPISKIDFDERIEPVLELIKSETAVK